jgi:glycosyltransferase involved in cell wall biosynthesis
MESVRGAVILASGLPLRPEHPTSFERQLRFLSTRFRALGYRARVVGPAEARRAAEEPGVRAAILLGYPDQFRSLLEGPALKAPVFLWAQCSKPPDPRAFDFCKAVPLTKKTEVFLREAGVTRIEPVIPHGVDTDSFRPLDDEGRTQAKRSFGLRGRFVVGTVGANSRRKRFDLIIEAFSIFRNTLRDAALVIKTDRAVGLDGTDLQNLARKHCVGRTSSSSRTS